MVLSYLWLQLSEKYEKKDFPFLFAILPEGEPGGQPRGQPRGEPRGIVWRDSPSVTTRGDSTGNSPGGQPEGKAQGEAAQGAAVRGKFLRDSLKEIVRDE